MTTRSNFLRPLSLLPLILLFSSCSDNPIAPEGFIGHSGGCGNFMVYKFNVEKTDAVVVRGTDSGLDFNRNPTEYTLPDPRLTVSIERFSGPANAHYCDDVFERHVMNATTRPSGTDGGYYLAKRRAGRVMDAAMAAVNVVYGTAHAPEAPAKRGISVYIPGEEREW